jgi:YD repeat-containing protein
VIDSSWDSNGSSTHFVYDAASRMTSISTNNGETKVAFGYDAANRKIWEDQTVAGYSTHGVVTPSDADGNRQKVEIYTNGALNYGPLYYDYTQRGQLARIRVDASTSWFTYRYDASGNLIKRQGLVNGVGDSINVMDPAGNSALRRLEPAHALGTNPGGRRLVYPEPLSIRQGRPGSGHLAR